MILAGHELGFTTDSHHIYRTCSCGGVMVRIDTARFPPVRWLHDHRMHVEDVERPEVKAAWALLAELDRKYGPLKPVT
jgi:hypothetical protein